MKNNNNNNNKVNEKSSLILKGLLLKLNINFCCILAAFRVTMVEEKAADRLILLARVREIIFIVFLNTVKISAVT